MTEADFKLLISPKMKAEEIEDDQVLVVEELVNVTLPIIDSTYVNHHLDKSLLMVSSFALKLSESDPSMLVALYSESDFVPW